MSTLFLPVEPAVLVWLDGLPHYQTNLETAFLHSNSLAESVFNFREGHNLQERWQSLELGQCFSMVETAFSIGLNFLDCWSLWLKLAPKHARFYYYACEKHPLTRTDLADCLSLFPQLSQLAEQLLAQYPLLTPGYHHLSFNDGRVNLILMLGDMHESLQQLLVCGDRLLENQLRSFFIDAWILNGLPPQSSESWQESLCCNMALLSKPATTLTACDNAAAMEKHLTAAGFTVSCKNNRLYAEFTSLSCRNLKRNTAWHTQPAVPVKDKKALIIGAGLAGCFTAYALAKRGWQVTVMDDHTAAGMGASGNRHAILYPQLSAYASPLNSFMLSAYLFAKRFYASLPQFQAGLNGILQLAFDDKEQQYQQNLLQWLNAYPQLARPVGEQEASELAGIKLQNGGLLIPGSGWIDSQALCQYLINQPGITFLADTRITTIHYEQQHWHAGGHEAEILILASGFKLNQFEQTAHLPLKSIRGQMTWIQSNAQSSRLKIPICAKGHILPEWQAQHAVGASYHTDCVDENSHKEDDLENIIKLQQLATETLWSSSVQNHWTGIRAATPDYLPLAGRVPANDPFRQRFSGLADNSKRWIPAGGVFQPGLFVCSGFGSRGLTSIPICAEWLASLINQEPETMSQRMIKAISPARFEIRKIVKGS